MKRIMRYNADMAKKTRPADVHAHNIQLTQAKTPSGNYEAIVVFVDAQSRWKSMESDKPAGPLLDRTVQRTLATGLHTGKRGEVVAVPVDDQAAAFARVILAGVGTADQANGDSFRLAAAGAVRLARKLGLKRVLVAEPAQANVVGELSKVVEAIANGLVLGGFEFVAVQGTLSRKAEPVTLKVDFATSDGSSFDRGVAIARGQNFARTIASLPGNLLNPPELARVAVEMCRGLKGLTCRVIDEKQMRELGMGGLLGVGAGSRTPPRLIAMEYTPAKKTAAPPLLVVGKAITFDAGGISIKPAEGMGEMIYDKCGAMAVLGLMHSLGEIGSTRRVIGLLASAENVLSADSYRPGDVLTHYNGITVEITNTDAEGRLVLADALSWGIEQYKPEGVVDLATLTGGCVVALGHAMAGAFANDDGIFTQIHAASVAAGEKLWRLPLDEHFSEKMKSTHADLVNSAGRWGSPCTAAAYLAHFVERAYKAGKTPTTPKKPVPWVHLDIAGVADSDKDLPLTGKGATGFGVRTLVEWVKAGE